MGADRRGVAGEHRRDLPLRLRGCWGRAIPSHDRYCLGPGAGWELRKQLTPVLKVFDGLGGKIRIYDRNIQHLAKKRHPEALHLAEVPSVGVLTALAFVLTIEDP